ncbi:MAG TPA: DUF5615 family PIN-like protein [Caldimonas sp.]|jgi:hypothetical protein|nr:DUF5615 family PIN-like protein [Caldimonas sp.]HEX2541501.1 DUF5615 family PIN-like protein [Caldimonas sp.]
MTFKFLIDECLSPELVDVALLAGHFESSCVRNRGWLGLKDRELIEKVVAEDFTLVTQNATDFRGGGPGKLSGQHAKQPVHAGLVCLDSHQGLDLDRQRKLFQIAIEQAETEGDLVNKALEVFELEDGSVEVGIFDIPAPTDQSAPASASARTAASDPKAG